jgi:hypothetical protein
MFLQIGENKVIRKKDVLGIFDMDSSTVSIHTRKFLSDKQRENKVIPIGYDLPKSFIVMKDKTIYLSPYNSKSIK